MTTYQHLRELARARLHAPVRSIRFRRGKSAFSALYMPKRLRGSSNGSFMRAPRTERS